MNNNEILLPGLDSQYKFLISRIKLKDKNILILGSESTTIAVKISEHSGTIVKLIVEDYESLLNSKLKLNDNQNVSMALMDFEFTDFADNSFNLIYAQASINTSRRNKIMKEIKRVLTPGGFLCVGEITANTKVIPKFIQNVFDNSDIFPLEKSQLEKYYADKNFETLDSLNLTFTLKDYYTNILSMLNKGKKEMTDKEKSYYKKLLNKIGHEAKVYLNQGGEKFYGFTVSLLKFN